ncbi:helix-turn-helix transcriptional regulator [Kordia sp.]|uniref:helix-turn-helix transcriptional regulator n=1 Tax=Kordia sp. TaxID=1965332 RepID=UPI003B5C8AA2
MVLETTKPAESLQPFLKEYYFIHLQAKQDVKHIPLIDDGCYDFVFFKEAKANFFHGEKSTMIPIQYKVFTIHDLKPPFKMTFSDMITFFTIKVQPWTNAYFFSYLPTKGILDVSIKNTELSQLHNQLFTKVTIAERIELANSFMHSKNLKLSANMEFVKRLCEHIYTERGVISVNDLAITFGKSRQYLNKIFKKEVLYSLKKFIITVRILDLVKYKVKHPEISLTKLSYDYGYFDQSHFIRDFKNIAGATPRYYFNNLPEFLLRH